MSGAVSRRFDVGTLEAAGARALLDGLRTVGAEVLDADYDAATGILTVELTDGRAAPEVERFVTAGV